LPSSTVTSSRGGTSKKTGRTTSSSNVFSAFILTPSLIHAGSPCAGAFLFVLTVHVTGLNLDFRERLVACGASIISNDASSGTLNTTCAFVRRDGNPALL